MSTTARNEYANRCYHGDPPPCVCACPFGVDVITLNKRLQKGRFNSAYTLYRDQVVFPGIICGICDQPCREACVRRDIDGGLSMRLLERAVVEFADQTTPRRLNLPKKDKSVAIVGAGPCGLICAYNLATHGYSVSLYEKTNRIGGSLWSLLPSEVFLHEIGHQMQYLEYQCHLEEEVGDLADLLPRHQAVLIATGKSGETFGMLAGHNPESLGCRQGGIFVAGEAAGAKTATMAFEHGIRVSQSIETYLQINRMHELSFVRREKTSRLIVDTRSIVPHAPVRAERYTEEEATREASRCVFCDCEECRRSCEMLTWFRQLPKSVVADVRDTLRITSEMKVHGPKPLGSVTKRLISSCTDCGLCNEVCTENIDLGSFLIESRRIMHQNGTLPPVFHDYWLRDMALAQGDTAYLAKNAPGAESSEYLFFPGCQLGASDPAYVKNSYAYLLEKHAETGLMLGCCGIPAVWAGDDKLAQSIIVGIRETWEQMGRPIAVLACPTCHKVFSEHLPEIRLISLYEIMAEEMIPAKSVANRQSVSVFDPCASRHDESMQRSVRSLLEKLGLEIRELPYRGRTAKCCGNGGHIFSANPELADTIAQNDVKLGDAPYVTYCANCRDIFSYHGKSCRHVLDMAFGENREWRGPPSVGERRNNRERLKAELLKGFWKEDSEPESKDPNIIIGPDLLDRLNRNLTSADEIFEVIHHCEKSGNKLLDAQHEYYIGHLKKGLLTYWVFYKIENGQYQLINAYCHRMSIDGE